MISETEPKDWTDLQNQVAQILIDCGWNAETEKTIDTVRGKVEIDVYGYEMSDGRRHSIICECKHWKSKIPQHVIYSFRTVVSDIGANIGYLIAPKGFQSGSVAASEFTNIELVTWNDFQDRFEETWIREYFCKELESKLKGLASYLEPMPAMAAWDKYLDDEHVERLKQLFFDNQMLGAILLMLRPGVYQFRGGSARLNLPLSELDENKEQISKLPDNVKNAKDYREFLFSIIEYGTPLLEEFRSFRDMAFERKAKIEGNITSR